MGSMSWWKRWWRAWRVFRLLLWTIWVIYRERNRVIRARQRGNNEVRPNIEVLIKVLVAFRKTALELGVLMIKLGQFLSSRADLLPEQALSVLSSLQDEVPPEPFEHTVRVIESELKKPVEELFTILERKCIAAASLGQVHKAVLASTGETVAVKVQRPNIDDLIRMDLGTIRLVIRIINRFFDTSNFIDLMGVYREFRRTVYEEVDYVTEAANAKRFKEMFQDDPTIYIPTIHEEYTTRRVLILEWIDGIKVNDYTELEAAGVNRLEVANRIVKAYFHQFFNDGFFHADPHPGNIFVRRDSPGNDPVVAFVDFGMVGSITKSMKRNLKDIFTGFITRDSRTIVNGLTHLGFIGEGGNSAAIERALNLMLEQYYGITLGEVRDLDFSDIRQEIENLLYGQPFRIPAQFAFTGRAVGTLVGVSTGLAPNFNFINVATPYARQFLGVGLNAQNIEQTVQEVIRQLLETGRVLMTLPRSLEQVVQKIETGQVEVRVANIPGARRPRGRNRGSVQAASSGGGGLTLPFMFLASLLGGIYLTNIHQFATSWFCLGISGLIALVLLIRR
jgi:predicted unusual protein kinase regulating ubiquinone biosynthesis (AarF/ABC1/UbiB family)